MKKIVQYPIALFFFLSITVVSFFSHGLENSKNSYFKTVALPLDGLLIKGIPHRNRSLFKAEDLLVSNAERSNNFVLRPFTKIFLTELIKNNYKVIILSNFSTGVTQSLLSSIKLEKLANQTVDQLAQTKIVDFAQPLDFESLGFDEFTLLLTLRGIETLTVARNLNLGPRFYAFPDFKSSAAARAILKNETELVDFFPTNEVEWFNENFNLARTHTALEHVLRDSFISSLQALRELENQNVQQLTQEGIDYFEAEQTPLRFRLLKDDNSGKFSGCEKLVVRTRTKSKVALAECVDQIDGVVFAFKDIKRSLCFAYSSELDEITAVDSRRCKDYVVLYNSKAKKNVKLNVFSGMESMSVDEIFRKYSAPPTEKDPIRLFEPWNSLESKDHLNLVKCVQLQGGRNAMGFDPATHELYLECKTDTLYSWGNQAKLDVLLSQIGNSSQWAPIKTIFLSRGPISTFGYGPIPIRIKLKKGVSFKAVSFGRCDYSHVEEAKKTVFVRTDGSYSDWSICNPAVIHSWSHSTREHYDEMIKEYQHHDEVIRAGKRILGFIEIYGNSQQQTSLFGSPIDGHPYSREILISQFVGLINRIERKAEQIFYNPDLPPKERTREAHFSTDHPTYFNEK